MRFLFCVEYFTIAVDFFSTCCLFVCLVGRLLCECVCVVCVLRSSQAHRFATTSLLIHYFFCVCGILFMCAQQQQQQQTVDNKIKRAK